MTVAFNYLGKMGQLGNQMFQFAATLGVARYTGVTYTIPNHDEVLIDGLGNRLRIELFDCFVPCVELLHPHFHPIGNLSIN